MELPPFPEKRPKGRIRGTKVNKKEREGEILFDHKIRKFYIQKGDEIIGKYDTMTEAFYYKKLLMDNNWDRNVLKTNITETIEVNIVIDQTKEYKVKLKEVFSTPIERLREMGRCSLKENAQFWHTKEAIHNYLDNVVDEDCPKKQ